MEFPVVFSYVMPEGAAVSSPKPMLTLCGVPIPVVYQTRFLGLNLDDRLSYPPHVTHLKSQCYLLHHVSGRSGEPTIDPFYVYTLPLFCQNWIVRDLFTANLHLDYFTLSIRYKMRASILRWVFFLSPKASLEVEAKVKPLSL